MLNAIKRSAAVFIVAVALIASCKEAPKVSTTVSIDKPERTVLYISDDAADTVQLTSTIKPSPVGFVSLWSTHDPSIADVDQASGLVTAKSIGKTYISADVYSAISVSGGDGKDPFGGSLLNMKDDLPENTIEISVAARIDTHDGGTKNVTDFIPRAVVPEGGSNNSELACEPEGKIWIESDGSITILDPSYVGTVTVKCPVAGGGKSEFDIELGRLATGITVDTPSLTLVAGRDQARVSAQVLPEDASDRSFTWVSSNPSCVSVTAEGTGLDSKWAVIKALKAPKSGQSVLVYAVSTDGGYRAPVSVTVLPVVKAEGVRLYAQKADGSRVEAGSERLNAGSKCQLIAEVLPFTATVKDCKWTVLATADDESWNAISVDDNGLVSGQSLGGKARVRVETVDGGYTAYCSFVIGGSKIVVGDEEVDPVAVGNEADLVFENACASKYPVRYSVSDPELASVNDDGELHIYDSIKDSGKVFDVVITYNDGSRNIVKIIIGDEVRPTEIRVTGSKTLMVYVGFSRKLEYDILPEDVTIKDAVFASDDESVVTVASDGRITAVGEGETDVKVFAKRDKSIYNEWRVTARKPIVELKVYEGSTWKTLRTLRPEANANFNDVLSGITASDIEYDNKCWTFSYWTMLAQNESEATATPSNLNDDLEATGLVVGDISLYAKYEPAPVSITYMKWVESGESSGRYEQYLVSDMKSGDVIELPDAPPVVSYGGLRYSLSHWVIPEIPRHFEENWTPFGCSLTTNAPRYVSMPTAVKDSIIAYPVYIHKNVTVKYMHWDNNGWSLYREVALYSGDSFDDLDGNQPSKVQYNGYAYKFQKWIIPSTGQESSYASNHQPGNQAGHMSNVPEKVVDDITVYARYEIRMTVTFKAWNDTRGAWVVFAQNDMLNKTDIPYPETDPETEYLSKRYQFVNWIWMENVVGFTENSYTPANSTKGDVVVADNIRDDATVYARYAVLNTEVKYMIFNVQQNKWVIHDTKYTQSGNTFVLPSTVPQSFEQDGKTYCISGWTATDLSSVNKLAQATVSSSELLVVGTSEIDGSMSVYACYTELLAYEGLVEIGPVSNYTLTFTENESTATAKVSISKFYMSNHEVTHKEWVQVLGDTDPSKIREITPGFSEATDDLPVEGVKWDDAIEFCNTLSVLAGLNPCYSITSGIFAGKKVDYWVCDFSANGFRLPTEVEWAYAATGGESYPYAGGTDLSEFAWYKGNSGYDTYIKMGKHAVKTKTMNGFGLYDMCGNVEEWCYDWYVSLTVNSKKIDEETVYTYDHPCNNTSNYRGPAYAGDLTLGHVVRGGTFRQSDEVISIFERYGSVSDNSCARDRGFRVCRSTL